MHELNRTERVQLLESWDEQGDQAERIRQLFCLLSTFSDSGLRNATLKYLSSVAKLAKEPIISEITNFATSKSVKPTTDAFLVLQWSFCVLQVLGPEPELVKAQSLLILKCSHSARQRQMSSVFKQTICFFSLFVKKHSFKAYLDLLDSNKDLGSLVLVSLLAGAATKVYPEAPSVEGEVSKYTTLFCEVYNSVVLGVRSLASGELPLALLHQLEYMFSLCTQKELDATLAPALCRSLLRSPEVVLYVLPLLLDQLKVDWSGAAAQLVGSLIALLGSSNADLRKGSASVSAKLLEKCGPEPSTPFKDALRRATSSEQRMHLAKILRNVHGPVDALAVAASKELTEASVHELALSLVAALPDPKAIEAIQKGLSDKRMPLLREWASALALGLTEELPSQLEKYIEDIRTKVVENPNTALTSKYIAAGYACALLKPSNSALNLFDQKVYHRLTAENDILLAIKAAGVVADPSVARLLIHFCIAPNVSPQVRMLASSTGLQLYPDMPLAFATALEEYLDSTYAFEDPQKALRFFSSKIDPQMATEVLAKVIVVVHYLAGSKSSQTWIDLCLSAGVDPASLVKEKHADLVNLIWSQTKYQNACHHALATIAFVAPEVVVSDITEFITTSLKHSSFSQDDLIIWRTPEAEVAPTAEVLKKKNVSASRGKDKELDAWEAEVRRELVKKQGSKLSKEDMEILSQQKEVREQLKTVYDRYTAAFKCITTLSEQKVDNGIEKWFPVAVFRLLELSDNLLCSSDAIKCYSGLIRNVTDRFEDVKDFISGASLYMFFPKVSQDLVGANPQSVTKVLYRAKFLADQRPLDRVSLMYILPSLGRLLEAEDINTEDHHEQLILALDILAKHADELVAVPRYNLVSSLIALLKYPQHGKITKDCLQRIASGIDFTQEELQVVLSAVVSSNAYTRASVLEIIDADMDLSPLSFVPEIWIALFGENASIAQVIWEDSEFSLASDSVEHLLPFLESSEAVRTQCAKSVSAASSSLKEDSKTILALMDIYKRACEPPKIERDEYGLEVKKAYIDPWQKRSGCLEALGFMVPALNDEDVLSVAEFVSKLAVADPNLDCAKVALELGESITSIHGNKLVDRLLPVFEKAIDEEGTSAVRAARVVLYGSEARHLLGSDSRLEEIAKRLIQQLDSTSETVQSTVGNCISYLASKLDISIYIDQLLEQVQEESTKEKRLGAAYGIAGIVKGVGLSALSDYNITRTILECVDDKKIAARRQGAQMVVSCLSKFLGKHFEPYALRLMPTVLAGLGDVQATVREAAAEAARSIMKFTSGYGIGKQVPITLEQLDSNAWRGKKGAVEMLGTMAYLDPTQLSQQLTVVIPEIVAVSTDSHKEVRLAAKQALRSFGDVIENPEIKLLVPKLLSAISDPTKNTEAALDGLLKTKFVHYIDSPSLALVIHVIKRALRDRSPSTKRRACQIVGNMSILADAADLAPYLPEIMPSLQIAMVDPAPTTCATACKALGVLVEKLGESQFPQVIPDMINILRDPTRSEDWWGCAQGLAEVLHGLGQAKLEEYLPIILKNCASPQPSIRESFMPLMLFLPSSFGQNFTPYISQIVPSILQGLADSHDAIRDNALKAGRRIVQSFADKSQNLLLPELESGLGDPNYRIRLSSVELLGDLLFQLAGVSRQSTEGEVSGRVQTVLRESLGVEVYDRVLASIFICRADIVAQVRSAAFDVWMSLVLNTPRTVKEILPMITSVTVKRLSSNDVDLRAIGARALGEVVRRVSAALANLLPLFEQLMSDLDARVGVCLGLEELIHCSTVEKLQENEQQITALVRQCLTDPNPEIREAAGRTFDALHEELGEVAQDILPELIKQMEDGDSSALGALKEMMSTSAEVVFPALVPKLISSPIDSHKASNLADVCEFAGDIVRSRIESIVDALLNAQLKETDVDDIDEALTRILNVCCPNELLLSKLKNSEISMRICVFKHLSKLFVEEIPEMDYVSDWVHHGILSLDSEKIELVEAAFSMLTALMSVLKKPELTELGITAEKALRLTSSPLAGFQLPKGPSCVLPIFLNTLVAGSNTQKEVAATGIAQVIDRTEVDNLKPFVTQITGPLIRVLGERSSAEIKAGIMRTLKAELTKIPASLKPFLPQLQRTILKSLMDPSNALLRSRSVSAFSTLVELQARVDPIAKELITALVACTETEVMGTLLEALFETVSKGGSKLSDPIKQSILEALDSANIAESNIKQNSLLAKVMASMVPLMPSQSQHLVRQLLSSSNRLLSVLIANALVIYAPEEVNKGNADELATFLSEAALSESSDISEAAVSGIGKILLGPALKTEVAQRLVSVVVSTIVKSENRSQDTRRRSLLVVTALVQSRREIVEPHFDELIGPLFESVRDPVISVKLAAESAFLEVFKFVELGDASYFDEWFAGAVERGAVAGTMQRSMAEYVRRVATRHAVARREQIQAGAHTDTDLSEIWQVGTADIPGEV